jgi:hypothetical protein
LGERIEGPRIERVNPTELSGELGVGDQIMRLLGSGNLEGTDYFMRGVMKNEGNRADSGIVRAFRNNIPVIGTLAWVILT